MAGHRAGAASRRDHTPARPNWLKADANKVKQARGRESHLEVELGEAWRGLRRAGWSGMRARFSSGVGKARERAELREMRWGTSAGHWRGSNKGDGRVGGRRGREIQ
jgi:hypothetical protein